eukprot:gene42126-biopygen5934
MEASMPIKTARKANDTVNKGRKVLPELSRDTTEAMETEIKRINIEHIKERREIMHVKFDMEIDEKTACYLKLKTLDGDYMLSRTLVISNRSMTAPLPAEQVQNLLTMIDERLILDTEDYVAFAPKSIDLQDCTVIRLMEPAPFVYRGGGDVLAETIATVYWMHEGLGDSLQLAKTKLNLAGVDDVIYTVKWMGYQFDIMNNPLTLKNGRIERHAKSLEELPRCTFIHGIPKELTATEVLHDIRCNEDNNEICGPCGGNVAIAYIVPEYQVWSYALTNRLIIHWNRHIEGTVDIRHLQDLYYPSNQGNRTIMRTEQTSALGLKNFVGIGHARVLNGLTGGPQSTKKLNQSTPTVTAVKGGINAWHTAQLQNMLGIKGTAVDHQATTETSTGGTTIGQDTSSSGSSWSDYVNSSGLRGQGEDQDLTTDPEKIHKLSTNHFKDWYAAPVLSEEEEDIHTSVLDWQKLSGDKDYFMEQTKVTKVPDKYRQLAFDALNVQGAEIVNDQLTKAFEEGPSLEDFITAISTAPKQSAPGVTGFTYAMMKAWPPEAMKLAYKALSTMWTDKYIPPWWKWRWLVPVPKKKDPGMADLRPLTLVEATRKIWSRLIIMKITRAWDNNSVLNAAQHGFRNKMSTMTATLQYINSLEDARESGQPIHRSSWDMSKAFDTVSKPAMMIAWLRLGVPEQIATWLVGLDMDGRLTPSARRAWQQAHYQGIRAGENNYTQKMRPMTRHQLLCVHMIDAFKAELGTGQGDVSSPMCWNALFDILLVMLEHSDQTPYYCRGATGNMYKSGETAFADDMKSTSATNSGMQDKANVVSALCLIFGLRISPSKLRRYFQDWSNNVGQEELTQMTVYTKGWTPNTVEIEVDGITSYLGAKYEIQTGNQPQMLQDILDVAREHCNAIQHTTGSPMSKLMVVTTSTYKKIQYQAKKPVLH